MFYVVKLNARSTSHSNVYNKCAIIAINDYDEYTSLLNGLKACNTRLRKKQVSMINDVTALMSADGRMWYIYVEYRYAEKGAWENDILEIISRKRIST